MSKNKGGVKGYEGVDDSQLESGLAIHLPPLHYVHVLNTNISVTRLEIGPQRLITLAHERVVTGPNKMIVIPPMHYAVIANPVVRTASKHEDENEDSLTNKNDSNNNNNNSKPKEEKKEFGSSKWMDDYEDQIKLKNTRNDDLVYDKSGQVKVKHAEQEIRLRTEEPFPLYPGESLVDILPLTIIASGKCLKLRALRDFRNEKGKKVTAGEEWLLSGPLTYIPRVEVEIVSTVSQVFLKWDQALRLKATADCTDWKGIPRKTGELWLVRTEGAYMPRINEEVLDIQNGYVIDHSKSLHLRATRTFTDVYGIERKVGEEWLVDASLANVHIPDVYEQVVGISNLIVVDSRSYAVIVNPWDPATKKTQFNQKKEVVGPTTFFLQPGESLQNGKVKDMILLAPHEGLYLSCSEAFVDSKNVRRRPGDKWMVYGPQNFVTPHQVTILAVYEALINVEALQIFSLFWSKSNKRL